MRSAAPSSPAWSPATTSSSAGRYAAAAAALSTEGYGAVAPIPHAARVREALAAV